MGRSIRRVLLPLSSAALLTLAGCSTQPRWDAEGFHNWLEEQLSAGLNHPVELGPLLGFGQPTSQTLGKIETMLSFLSELTPLNMLIKNSQLLTRPC